MDITQLLSEVLMVA